MSKTKRIKALKEFIELEKLNKEPVQEYIDWAEYENRKLIKAGERESYRQRKIRLNRERRQALKTA